MAALLGDRHTSGKGPRRLIIYLPKYFPMTCQQAAKEANQGSMDWISPIES